MDEDPINLPDLDVEAYYALLLDRCSIEELREKQGQWKADLIRLDAESRDLIQKHHSKYLKAAQLMKRMMQFPEYISGKRERLECLYQVALKRHQEACSDAAQSFGASDVRTELLRQYQQYSSMGPVFQVPSRMRAFLSANQYGQAINEYVQFFDLISKASDAAPFEPLKEECKSLLLQATECILEEFKTVEKSLDHDISDVKVLISLGVHADVLCQIFLVKMVKKWKNYQDAAGTGSASILLDWLKPPSSLYNFIYSVYRPYYGAYIELFPLEREQLFRSVTEVDNEIIHMILSHQDLENVGDNIILLLEYVYTAVSDESGIMTDLPFEQEGRWVLLTQLVKKFLFPYQAEKIVNKWRSSSSWIGSSEDWNDLKTIWEQRGSEFQELVDAAARTDANVRSKIQQLGIMGHFDLGTVNPWEPLTLLLKEMFIDDMKALFFVPKYVLQRFESPPVSFKALHGIFISAFVKKYYEWILAKSASRSSADPRSFILDLVKMAECYKEIYFSLSRNDGQENSIQTRLATLLLQDNSEPEAAYHLTNASIINELLTNIIHNAKRLSQAELEILIDLSHLFSDIQDA